MNDEQPLTGADMAAAGHRGDIAKVRRGLQDRDPDVRRSAIGAAARTGLLTQAMATELLSDTDPNVRQRLLRVLAAQPWAQENTEMAIAIIDAPGTEPAGPEAAGSHPLKSSTPDATTIEVTAFTLGELAVRDPIVIEWLELTATSHPDHLCREAAVASLGALESGLATILAALADRNTVRRRAVIALAPFDGDEVHRALEQALEDRDWQVRQIAEDLLHSQPGLEPDLE